MNTRIIVPRSDAVASREPSPLNDSAVTQLWHADICNNQPFVCQEGGGGGAADAALYQTNDFRDIPYRGFLTS